MNDGENVIVVDKNWSFEEALDADRRARASNPELRNSLATPYLQWSALQDIDFFRPAFETGHTKYLLPAINLCAKHQIPMPDWVRKGFIDCYKQIENYEAKSWDDVFDRPHPKGIHLAKAAQRRKLTFDVHRRVREILRQEPETPIDDGLFERVGSEFGIGKTLTNKLYYELQDFFGEIERGATT